jgi:phosphoglycolate phosphatase
MPGYVYIDLDGTLTDPFEGISNCIAYAMQRLGEARPEDVDMRRFIGPPLLDTFTELLGSQRAPRALEYYRERFGDTGWLENAVYPGIPEALAAMTAAGHRCFVATSKPRVFARRIIEHFELSPYFAAVYGSELDGTRTDKTDLLRFAAAERSAARESVMIGDRHHDVVGAINNGFQAIGATWGYGTADELLGAGAGILATVPEQLPGLVQFGEG